MADMPGKDGVEEGEYQFTSGHGFERQLYSYKEEEQEEY